MQMMNGAASVGETNLKFTLVSSPRFFFVPIETDLGF